MIVFGDTLIDCGNVHGVKLFHLQWHSTILELCQLAVDMVLCRG